MIISPAALILLDFRCVALFNVLFATEQREIISNQEQNIICRSND
jgi:hypothetical protein